MLVLVNIVTVAVLPARVAFGAGNPLHAAPALPRQPVTRCRLLRRTPARFAPPPVPRLPEPSRFAPLTPVPLRVVAARRAHPRDVAHAVTVARTRCFPHKVPVRNGAIPFDERPLQLAPHATSYSGVFPRIAPPAPRVGLALAAVEKVEAPVVGAGVRARLAGVPLEALSVRVLVHVRVGGETPLIVHAPHAVRSRRATSARRPQRARLVRARPVAQRGNSPDHRVVGNAPGHGPHARVRVVMALLAVPVELALFEPVVGTLVQGQHGGVPAEAAAVHEIGGHFGETAAVAEGAALVGREALVAVGLVVAGGQLEGITGNRGVLLGAGQGFGFRFGEALGGPDAGKREFVPRICL